MNLRTAAEIVHELEKFKNIQVNTGGTGPVSPRPSEPPSPVVVAPTLPPAPANRPDASANFIGKSCTIKAVPAGGRANIRDSANGKVIESIKDGVFPVKIREFVGDYASVEVKIYEGTEEFGAHVGKPAFVHKSQFDFSKCK